MDFDTERNENMSGCSGLHFDKGCKDWIFEGKPMSQRAIEHFLCSFRVDGVQERFAAARSTGQSQEGKDEEGNNCEW